MNLSSISSAQPSAPPIRVAIADDHPVVRSGIQELLHHSPGFQLIGEAADGEEAIRLSVESSPDILLLDLKMPRISGQEALRAINARSPQVKVILLVASISQAEMLDALKAGARGILLKASVVEDIVESLEAVVSGDYWIRGTREQNLLVVVDDLIRQMTPLRTEYYGLTSREFEVIDAVLSGACNRQIATQLSISEDTVKRHLSSIFDKVGASSRLELAVFAVTHDLSRDRNPS